MDKVISLSGLSRFLTKCKEIFYQKPSTGVPASDLDSEVQTSLEKADSSLQSIKTFASQILSGSGDVVRKHTMEIVSESQQRCVLFWGQTKNYTALVSIPSANFFVLVCASGSTGIAYDYSDCVDAWGPLGAGAQGYMILRFKTGSRLTVGQHDLFITFLNGDFGNDTVTTAGGAIPTVTTPLTVVNYYQKPSTGIPASDLAAGVIPTLKTLAGQSLTGSGEYVKVVSTDEWLRFFHSGAGDTYEPFSAIIREVNTGRIAIISCGDILRVYDFGGFCTKLVISDVLESVAVQFNVNPEPGHGGFSQFEVFMLTGKNPVIEAIGDGFPITTDYSLNIIHYYSKPSTGIPASDLANGVIPTVPQISTNITTDASSNTKTASPKAVKDYVDANGMKVVTYGTSVSEIPSAPLCYVSRSDVLDIIPNAGSADDQITSEPGVYLTRQDYSDAEENVRYSGIYSYYTFESSASVHHTCIITALYNAGDWELEVHDLYDEIHPTVASSQPSGGFVPNVMYNLGTLSGNTTFALATPADANITNHYYWTFDTGSTAPTITWPSSLSWFGDSAPTINASKHYEISVLNGIAVAMEV